MDDKNYLGVFMILPSFLSHYFFVFCM